MIYFDNSATTIHKPKEVAQEVYRGISCEEFGNPGRGMHGAAHKALSQLLKTRKAVARLFNIKNPLSVALCQNGSAAVNLTVKGLKDIFSEGSHVITTCFEHNSVLRPLYQAEEKGLQLSVLEPDKDTAQFNIENAIRKNTKAVVITHCSNVVGTVTDLEKVHSVCKKYGLVMIVDGAQSAGTMPIDFSLFENSIFCFTGHKGLYGPQGTGGIILNGSFNLSPVFSGGSGSDSFNRNHPSIMPDVFETGTMNVPSFMGLTAGCNFIAEKTCANIKKKLEYLRDCFIFGIKDITDIKIYGEDFDCSFGSSIAINIGKVNSAEAGTYLWENFGIATRSGAHCAPLLHKYFGTEKQGMVRFSFSVFNTEQEIQSGVQALHKTAKALLKS